MIATMLPPDNHVHTEWSWDAAHGSMEASCARAVELGLGTIAFTEHMDLTRWVITPGCKGATQREALRVGPDNRFNPPPLDTNGYQASIQACRDRYPGLRILSGVELGEPHWFGDQCAALLAGGAYDRALGSLHSLQIEGEPWIIDDLYSPYAPADLEPDGIMRAYLAEALRMIQSSDLFAVLAHIDYPVRAWPAEAGPFEPADYEEEYRGVLDALARSGRALEVNTTVPLRVEIVRWWYEVGGDAVSFGSDAHRPSQLARNFLEVSAMVEGVGFRPGRDAHDFWRRR
ncbi:MAG: PHP domain-containing protein [Actinomycetota bacterium]|nr:PHP domain-containing protein [Actinomycetota bacterium]